MSEENKENEKLKNLLSDLKSGNEDKAIKAIKSLKIYGNTSIAKDLFEVLLKEQGSLLEDEVLKLLSSLKVTEMRGVLMSAVADKKYFSIRQKLLSTTWQSGLNYSEYLMDFVKIAIEGDYMEQIECITTIENLDGPFEEEDIMESLLLLNQYFDDGKNKDVKIMKELLLVIKDFQNYL